MKKLAASWRTGCNCWLHQVFAARFICSVLRCRSSTDLAMIFQSLDVTDTKVRWCLTERDRGISTWQSPDSTDLVLRVGSRQGILSPPRCGICCTCALWRTVRAPTILRCSKLSKEGCSSCSPTLAISRSARRCTLSSRVRCERGHEIQAKKLHSRWERT